MAKLPVDLSGRNVRAVPERAGFEIVRQKGIHIIMRRDNPSAGIVGPDHKRVRQRTLRHIIADAGMTVEEFVGLLGR